MARKKKEEQKAGSPAWMATFSDLMNLLLCFFVLLFSMSTVDAEKFELVIESLRSSFSVLPAGGASINEGSLISAGVSQLEYLDMYFKDGNSSSLEDGGADSEAESEEELKEQYEEASLAESEQMAQNIEALLQSAGIGDRVDVDVNAQYVRLTLNGALLFDSGQSEIRQDAEPLVLKLGAVVETYAENMISIEGHTDNVPISGGRYEDNDVLSAYRALAVKDFFMANTALDPGRVRATSCGEYSPVADNTTAEGRAQNRRVEIKIYNSFNSY